MPSTTSGTSQASTEKPSQMVSRTSRRERGDGPPGVGHVDHQHRASAGMPDQDAQRDGDQRRDEQRQPGVVQLLKDPDRDASRSRATAAAA